jgi:hypothetical protein
MEKFLIRAAFFIVLASNKAQKSKYQAQKVAKINVGEKLFLSY